MQFVIDSGALAPPGQQLVDQVRFGIASGRLEAGEQLPSVRKLAAQVRVNPNTVSRAWRELEMEGVLESRRGTGVFVAPGATALCCLFRDGDLADRIGRAVAEARSAGLDADAVRDLVETALGAWGLEMETERVK